MINALSIVFFLHWTYTYRYGHIAPLTQNGKIFCIFYIIIGVPLTILILDSLVERLENRLIPSKSFKTLNRPRSYASTELSDSFSSQENSIESNAQTKCCSCDNIYLKIFIFGLFCITLVYVVPSLVLANITELNWSLIDAFYYCFISITTIGFGDFVPGQNTVGYERNVYRCLMTSNWKENKIF